MSGDLSKVTVPHPSDFIAEEMLARGWSPDDLAHRMSDGTDYDFGICRLSLDFYDSIGPTEPKMMMGVDTAERLAKAFDVSPEYFLALEDQWRRGMAASDAATSQGLGS